MNIELFTFAKRKNSTKAPVTTGATVSCVLKEETSDITPSFELKTNPLAYNYVKAFDRWYYIVSTDYVTNGIWRINCRMDSLATFASTIKTTRAFIEYSDSYDSRIYDPRLAKKINASEISTTASLPAFIAANATGYCAVTVLGSNRTGVYLLSYSNVQKLMQKVNQWWLDFTNNVTWADTMESLKNLAKLWITGDAAANIKACRWIPTYLPISTSDRIYAGFYDTEVDGQAIGFSAMQHGSFTLSVPHPTDVMLRTSATCEYTLFIPYIGTIPISADILADESSLTINFSIASCTGEIVFTVNTGSGKYIGSYGCNIGTDIPIGSSGVGVKGIVTTVGATALGAVVGGVGASGIEGATTGSVAKASITSASKAAAAGITQIQGTASSVGGIGSCASIGVPNEAKLTCSYWEVSDSGSNLTSLIGNPYYKADTIGNHGYVQCSGASVELACQDEILDEINSYLRGGIYVE